MTQHQPDIAADWGAVEESAPRPVLATHPLPYAAPEPQEWGKKVARTLTWVAVLACLAVLVMVFTPSPSARRGTVARITAAQTDLASLETAIDTFYADAGRIPTPAEGLTALVSPPACVPAWTGPYVKRQPSDPWGNPYQYRTGTSGGAAAYRIDSAGPDNLLGTADDITSGWVAAPTPGK